MDEWCLGVKGDEHAVPVRGVVDQFVRWFLGGTFRPITDETDWCRHIFRESNKAADTHANWLMDNGDSGPGAQWEAPDLHDKMQKSRHIMLSFGGARRESGLGAAAWILWLRDEYGSSEKVSYGGCVLRNASAMIAEREALRKGVEHLTVLFPTVVSSFDFQVEHSGRTILYKLNAQSLRLFGLHRDANVTHRASANRLRNKKTNKQVMSPTSSTTTTSQRVLKSSSRSPPATADPQICMNWSPVTTPSAERSLHHCSPRSEKIQRAVDTLITLLTKACCQVRRRLSVMLEQGDLFSMSLD